MLAVVVPSNSSLGFNLQHPFTLKFYRGITEVFQTTLRYFHLGREMERINRKIET